jgi:hypothetical protein
MTGLDGAFLQALNGRNQADLDREISTEIQLGIFTRTMNIRQSIALTGVIVMLVFPGCTSPKYSSVASIPADKALVYIYRKAALGGIAGNHHIFVNGQPVTSLYSGSYYPYFATPGTNIISSKMISPAVLMNLTINAMFQDDVCRLDTEAGKTYYVQFRIATTLGPKITQVDAGKGTKDITKCKLAESLQ